MEKKMENEMESLGPFKGLYRDTKGILPPNNGDSNGKIKWKMRWKLLYIGLDGLQSKLLKGGLYRGLYRGVL